MDQKPRQRQRNITPIRFRSDRERDLIRKAAELKRWSMNTFITEAARAAAERTVKRWEATTG